MVRSLPFSYRACGLTIASELELSGVPEGAGEPDVFVRRGAVPRSLEAPTAQGVLFEAARDQYLLCLEGTARYLVRQGREIIVEADRDSRDPLFRAIFFGSVLTALLHQRGVLVLHGGIVVGAHGAVILAGNSAAGKSTTLAALVLSGFRVLADDLAAVSPGSGGGVTVQPSVPHLALWQDAVARLGLADQGLARARADAGKYLLPVPSNIAPGPEPLAGIVILELNNGREVTKERLRDSALFTAVRAQTRNLLVVKGLELLESHFRLVATIADRVPVWRVTRPNGVDSVEPVVAQLMPLLE